MKTNTNMHGSFRLSIGAFGLAVLVGCGGGGGSASDNNPPPDGGSGGGAVAFDATAAQGRWTQADLTALVLPGASGAAEVWMVPQTPTHLFKVDIASTAKASGFKYPLSGTGAREALAGDAQLNATATPKTLSFANGSLSAYNLSQSDALAGGSALSDVAGNWTFTVSQGAVKFDATVSATGAFAASTVSDDCTYSGQLSTTTAATVYRITYQSVCQGNTASLSGVARWVSANNSLTILGVSSDAQTASLISMRRP